MIHHSIPFHLDDDDSEKIEIEIQIHHQHITTHQRTPTHIVDG
jgi:hypothetical protein